MIQFEEKLGFLEIPYTIFMAYSVDFREKVLAYCENIGSISEAATVRRTRT